MFKCNVQHSRTNQLISIVRAKKNRSLPFLVFRREKNQTVHVSKCENLNKFFESVLHCKGKQRHLSHDQIKNCTKKTIRKMFIIDVIKRNTLDMVRFGSAHFSCLCVSLLILLNCLARFFFFSLPSGQKPIPTNMVRHSEYVHTTISLHTDFFLLSHKSHINGADKKEMI